jgi:acyl-CoA thioesterase-2
VERSEDVPATAEPTVLQVEDLGDGRWRAPHPDEDPEKRDVVFSGQLLAQMLLASSATGDGKEPKSIHCVFARAGAYSVGPVEYTCESMHRGRAWASDTVTAHQGDRLLARSLVLSNTVEPDLMRHSPTMPDVAPPEECEAAPILVVFPGSEVRPVAADGARGPDGSPVSYRWVRTPVAVTGVAAQAVVAWHQPGFVIGTAMDAHRGSVDISDAHRSISTGVISHTTHFHDRGDPSDWLLVAVTASFAGNGRVFGSGEVFDRSGTLVSTFAQDAMARTVDRVLDPTRAM